MMRRRRSRRRGALSRRTLYWIGGVAAGVVLLPLLVIGVLIAMIDPNSYKAQIETAARQSLGRELHINGTVSVTASLSPKLVANDITLSNVPGGSRPDMMRIDQAEIELAPRALLTGRVVIARMALLRPDILLETDSAGRGNWQFERSAPAKSTVAETPSSRIQPGLLLQTLHIRDGRITWHDGRSGQILVLDVQRVSATAATAQTPVTMGAEVVIGRQHVTLSAQTAPLATLATANAQAPWTFFANLANSNAKLTVAASLTQPLLGRGYSLRVDGNIPDLSSMSWLSPVRLPPLHNLVFTGRVLDQGNAIPDISLVTIKTGLTNLDKIAPGFTLDSARIDMPRLSEPMVMTAEGNFAGAPFNIGGTIGAPALLLPGAKPDQSFNVDLRAEIGGASFGARGVIASPGSRSGLGLALGARVPDLSVFSPLAGRRLPSLKTIAFSSNLVDQPGGGYAHGFTLKDLVLTSPQGDVTGDISVSQLAVEGGAQPQVMAALKSGRLDVDGLLAVLALGRKADSANVAAAPVAADVSIDATEPLAVPQHSNTVIPDSALPLAILKSGDLDLRANVGELDAGGNVLRNLAAHALLNAGSLKLDPLTADLPAGPLVARMAIDSGQHEPPVALFLTAPGIDVNSILNAFGQGGMLTGKADLRVDLHATGGSLHALAASLDGHAAVALTNGDIDNAVLSQALAGVLRTARVSLDGALGRTALRCVAIQLNATHGIVTLAPAVLDSSRLQFSASGTVNLGSEVLALQLRPLLRFGGPGVVVPVRLDGSFNDPRLALESGAAARSGLLGLAAGLLGGKAGVALAGPASGDQGDACGPALASLQGVAAQHVGQ